MSARLTCPECGEEVAVFLAGGVNAECVICEWIGPRDDARDEPHGKRPLTEAIGKRARSAVDE